MNDSMLVGIMAQSFKGTAEREINKCTNQEIFCIIWTGYLRMARVNEKAADLLFSSAIVNY
jgi:hypothetical protein